MNARPVKVGAVVLTQGTRPDDLAAGIESLRSQVGVEVDIAVVGNGWQPTGLPAGVKAVALAENLGIPAGRNAGVDHVEGDLLFFLDDDARIAEPDFLVRAVAKFEADPHLGLIHPRVEATDGSAPTRWIPRVRKGDPHRSSPAFALWEGGTTVRRDVFEAAGRWPEIYRYAHEGIEFIWRVWDTGHVAWYAGDLPVLHPPINPTRHDTYWRFNARHRVWLARRNLHWPFSWAYVGTWTLVQFVRATRSAETRAGLGAWLAGWREGWATDPGPARKLKWATIWQMTLRGRPPIV